MSTSTVLTPEVSRHPPRSRLPVGRLLLVGLTVTAAYGPLLVQHALQMWDRPHYQFVPLIPVAAAVLLISRMRGLGPLQPGSRWLSLSLVGLAWLLLFAGEILNSPWFAAVALLVLAAAALYAVGDVKLFGAALPAWLLLWLAVPPPLQLDNQLVLALQTLTARWASAILDLFGIYHVMAGHVVETGGQRLLVEQACSGINSLFAILACTLFYVFLTRRPMGQAIALIIAALFWVMVANVTRVVLVTFAGVRWGMNLADGWRHEALGLVLFALALGLIWSTQRLILFLTVPAPVPNAPPVEEIPPEPTTWPDLRKTWLAGPTAVLGFGMLAVLHAVAMWNQGPGNRYQPDAVAACLDMLSEETLPAQWEQWQRLNTGPEHFLRRRNPGSAFGEFSKTWTYVLGPSTATLSLDYPFPNWHDLTSCYTGQGWAIDAQEVRHRATAAGPVEFVEVRLSKPAYRSGHLLFCEFDRRGQPLEALRGGAYLSLARHRQSLVAWWDRLRGLPASPSGPATPVYQLQLFVESHTPLTAEQAQQAEGLFLHAFDLLRKHWDTPAQP